MNFDKKTYWEQAHILKKFHGTNPDIIKIIDFLVDEVHDNLTDPIIPQLLDKDVIRSFLIGGILAFAREGKGYHREKNPSNLELTVDKNNNVMWDEWAWKDVIHTYKVEEMIYVTHYTEDISLMHTMYKGKLDFFNKELVLEEHTNSIVDVLSNDFLNINKVLKVTEEIKRSFKLKKIMSESD